MLKELAMWDELINYFCVMFFLKFQEGKTSLCLNKGKMMNGRNSKMGEMFKIEEENERYLNLAMAVIYRAIADYKYGLLERNARIIRDLEKFFLGEEFENINVTKFTGKQIMEMCKTAVAV